MFWGGMPVEARTELVSLPMAALNSSKCVVDILQVYMVPYFFVGDDFFLMHDNVCPHNALFLTDYLHEVVIPTTNWSPRSPNLNPSGGV